jgi:SP family general alpha glucoside:H+ symporter-like MFS transporter
MNNVTTEKPTSVSEVEALPASTGGPVYNVDEKVNVDYNRTGAIDAEKIEFKMTVLEAVKAYPAASWWAFVMSCTIVRCLTHEMQIISLTLRQIMESYCVFLMGQFIATQRFADDFGVYSPNKKKFIIEASWQSAFQCSGPVGAFMGVFMAGPITSRIGYRWATIGGLMFLNAFILIFYFGNSQGMFFAAQILEGIPWGIFIANAPAYCSEIVPMRLRAPATQMLQMFWAIGAIIVGGITYHYQSRDDPSAYRFVRSHRCHRATLY